MLKEDVLSSYIRVGTEYWRMSERPSAFVRPDGTNFTEHTLIKWSKDEIATDFGGKHVLKDVAKFIGFCNIPSHTDFRRNINKFYNQYLPLEFEPKEGKFPFTEKFLNHIFEEQYQLGLDYLGVLYKHPTKRLPILSLVSEERNTGKSTFIFWLKELFGGNVTLNTNEDFESKFNSDWTGKLIIGVEETLLEKKEIYERLKSLCTGKSAKTERKGKDKTELEFFGKFVLCSNFETTFVPMDRQENRFWVRKVKSFLNNKEKEIPDLLEKMKAEIPAFLHFINERKIQIPETGRLWFEPSVYETDALQRAKDANRPKAEQEIMELIGEIMEMHDVEKVFYTAKDLLQMVKDSGLRADRSYIDRLLKDNLKKSIVKNSSYQYFSSDTIEASYRKGRYYQFTWLEVFGKPKPKTGQQTTIEDAKPKPQTLENEVFTSQDVTPKTDEVPPF